MAAWAICAVDDPTLVGYCRLRGAAEWVEPGEVEVGYRLARHVWGRGYATDAALLARELAFTRFGAERLIAVIDPGNVPSIRVAQRLGMSPIRELMLPEYDHPDTVFAVDRSVVETVRGDTAPS